MKNRNTNFWDFADRNPEVIVFVSIFAALAIIFSVLAITNNLK